MEEERNLAVGAMDQYLGVDPIRHERWKHLTENLEKDDLNNCEILLDNMARHLHEESTSGANVAAFTTFAFPLVRRIYPQLMAKKVVSVQPMSQPTGKVFWLDFLDSSANRFDVQANFDRNYSDSTEGGAVETVQFDINDTTITAVKKALRAIWTIEAQQDLKAYHGLNAESELMRVQAEQIAREIDNIIFKDLHNASDIDGNVIAGNVNWSATGLVGDTNSTYLRAYRETLYESIIDANTLIMNARYRNASWIVGHPTTVARLQKLEGFKIDPTITPESMIQTGSRMVLGTLKNMYTVIQDPWHPYENVLLLGHKGSSWLDTGYVYAPYIMSYVTPLFTDPNDFKSRRGMMSRFGRQKVVAGYYATVTITNT